MVSRYIRSNVLGLIAIFIALGGTAAALPGKNTVDSGDIRNGQVKTKDAADAAITNAKLAPDSVDSSKITPDSLTGADIDESSLSGVAPAGAAGGDLQGSYPNPTIGPNAVGTNEVNATLTAADIADSGTLGTAEINETTLYNDNSLNDADIDQGSLGLAQGRTVFAAVAVEDNFERFVSLDELARVNYICPASPTTNNGTIKFWNGSGGQMNLFVDNGGPTPSYENVASNSWATDQPALAAGDRITYSYQTGNGRYGTVTVDSIGRAADCHVHLQALVSG